uniref:Membrane-spanning 4-domains subfamily A member 8 n=1 Tax=Phallusia mammillata TaxID=59560 RepID=A0A6F9DM30_9ASCI|nr:membrane-spanning 4-domains subfamily A member 8 [Phallusia mammillata]
MMSNQEHQKKFSTSFKVLGIVEIAIGAISIICGIIAITTVSPYFTFALLATGIWCGVFFIAAGIIGIISSRSCKPCSIIGGMVMSIVSALAGGVLLGMSVTAAILSFGEEEKVDLICHVLLCVCGLTAAIVSIVHASYCCAVTCCAKNTYNGLHMTTCHEQA